MNRWPARIGAAAIYLAMGYVLVSAIGPWVALVAGVTVGLVAGLWEGVWRARNDEREDGT